MIAPWKDSWESVVFPLRPSAATVSMPFPELRGPGATRGWLS